MFAKINKILVRYFSQVRWHTIVLALFFYGFTSWIMLYLAGEKDLLSTADFLYWLVVTGSTVGYGDMSPATIAGKYVVAFYIIPLGLSIFALVIGRIATWVSWQWKKGVKGLKDLQLDNHIVVIGWNENRTVQLLNLLLKEQAATNEKPEILLCVQADIENPLPEHIEFVKVSSFNRDEEMDRACITDASVIIMDNPADDMTMTTALYCSKRNPDAHLVAYFNDESLVSLLQQHCPNVECTPSVSVEMLVKSAFDPGSSLLHHDLLSIEDGQAQFSVSIPNETTPIPASKLFFGLKDKYDATFIGYVSAIDKNDVKLNPDFDVVLNPGDKIFYIAADRIRLINWQALQEV